MDVSTPTSLMMDFTKGPLCPSPSGASAFEFDFINGNFLTNEEDDILTTLYNKQPEDDSMFRNDNTFTSLSTIVNEKSLPDSPDSWVSNSSTSDNEAEDLELCEFTSPENVQKTKPTTAKAKQPPVMNAPIAAPFMNFPQVFQPGMMEAFMGQQVMPNMMPNMMVSPQQLMFMQQQQQIATFNAMNSMTFQPQFVPAPQQQQQQPKKQAKSPVKQERNSPSKGATKRRRESPEEIKEESPSRESTSPTTSSPSSSPTPDGEPKKDKDVKRQRRLIKNRESAQASRERKKIYVQGLEKKVDDLAQTNNALNSKVLTLEEENILLREKLMALDRDGTLAKELNEPNQKKRRLGGEQAKIPIPSLSQPGSSMNPFTNGFWNAFMSFSPPHMQTGAPQQNAWNPGTQSKKVVLFVMLFCVAVLVFSNRKNELDIKMNPSEGKTEVAVSRRISRTLKTIHDLPSTEKTVEMEDFSATIRPIVEDFFRQAAENATRWAEDEEEEEEVTEKTSEKEEINGVTMEFVKDKGLVLTFPMNKNMVDVKMEEGLVKPSKQDMDQLSKRFVAEICKQLDLQQH